MVSAVSRKKSQEFQAALMINHIAAQGDQAAVKKAMNSFKPKKILEVDDSPPKEDHEINELIERLHKR